MKVSQPHRRNLLPVTFHISRLLFASVVVIIFNYQVRAIRRHAVSA